MLDKLVEGMKLKPEDFIQNLKPLIEAKKAELAKSEYANLIETIEKQDEKMDEPTDEKSSKDPKVTKPEEVK